jgi:nitrate/nitrite-specific signal transduction histidine kinase
LTGTPECRTIERIARSTLAAALLLLVLVVLAAGCGKSKPKTATDWANDACSAVSDWTTSIADATDSLKGGNINKDSVQTAADDAKDATNKLTKDLKSLGKPPTESGAQAQQTVEKLANQIDEGVTTIENSVASVTSISNAANAIAIIGSTLTVLKTDITAAYDSLVQLKPAGELQQAFQQADNCSSFRTGG